MHPDFRQFPVLINHADVCGKFVHALGKGGEKRRRRRRRSVMRKNKAHSLSHLTCRAPQN